MSKLSCILSCKKGDIINYELPGQKWKYALLDNANQTGGYTYVRNLKTRNSSYVNLLIGSECLVKIENASR